jgi:pyridinium-3,5-bisthiocarboxylic acid mononucleotide nickel chelatase
LRVAHFDCFSGISGDMVLGALIDAGVPLDALQAAFASLNLPIKLEVEKVKRCGIAATKATVIAEDQEDYRFLPDVEAIVNRGSLTPKQRDLAMAIFRKVAAAESAVHGMPIEKVHFHEVGALDSIADIVGAAVGLDLLGVDQFTSSSVPTGSGTVKCAHGLMPVPAPATAELLKGVPLAKSNVRFELTTPTGAAILTSIVTEYTDAPAMTIEKIGTGAGSKDLIDQPNILRLFVGSPNTEHRIPNTGTDEVIILETNLDDCPGEIIGYAMECLFAAGALDVFTLPIQMKKSRPAVLLSVIAKRETVPELERILFRETATFGIRKTVALRSILQRELIVVLTPWGEVKAKRGWREGIEVISPEYEDCARLAKNHSLTLRAVYEAVAKAHS